MKKLLENKYVLIGFTLVIGVLLGWLLKPSSNSGVESHEGEGHELTMNEEGVWTCSMHPQIRQNEPGSCPLCGMALIPVEEDAGSDDPLAIKMSNTAMQLANVVTRRVSKGSSSKKIDLTGKVLEDERRISTQSSHIPGRIESLNVNFTGDYVRKGQVIASVYSPTLVTAQQELFEARKLKDTQPALFKAAKRKLTNWKLNESQIEQILSQEEPMTTFPILAESTGYVKEKMVNSGDYLKQGASLYTVSNLSRVWVLFDAYEADLQWIRVGNQIDFTVASIPGKPFAGEVTYIDPIINPNTRVAKVRVELANEGNALKPEMFVNGIVETQPSTSSELTVPKSAVMWTGKRSVVYVKSATDRGVSFRMREISLGSAYSDSYAVIDGLSDGDEIAVNGTFSIDAAAQLAGKPSMMSPEGGAAMTGHNHGGTQTNEGGEQMQEGGMETEVQHQEVNISTEKFESSAVFKEQIKDVFLTYLPLKDALIETDAKAAKKQAKPLLDAIGMVDMTEVKGEAHIEWMKDLAVLQYSAEYITKETDVEKIRSALSPLSDQLYQTILKFEVETGGFRQYCPMAFNNTGAFWLSNSDSVLNPYFGDVMLTCGNIEEELN